MNILQIGLLLACLRITTVGIAQPASAPADEKWIKKKESSGITVFEQQSPQQSLNYVKAEMTVQSSLKSLSYLLLDIEGYTDWVDRTKEAYVTEKVSNTTLYYRSVIDVPLIKDRDLVARFCIRQDKSSKVVKTEAVDVPGKYPVDKKFERLTNFQTTWTLVPLPDGKVRVEYVGVVPDDFTYAMVKGMIWDGLHQTFTNMRKLAGQPRKRSVAVDFIVEPE